MVKEKSLQQIVAGATGDLHAKECIKKKNILKKLKMDQQSICKYWNHKTLRQKKR